MRFWERLTRLLVMFGAFALAAYFAITFRAGGLWRGLEPALAVAITPSQKGPYDLTRLEAVNETLKTIRDNNVQGPWDVSARLRDVFGFVQDKLRGSEVDLREVEYAACNGMLHT